MNAHIPENNTPAIPAAIWAWWENNSFTPEAIRADELLDQMQGKIK